MKFSTFCTSTYQCQPLRGFVVRKGEIPFPSCSDSHHSGTVARLHPQHSEVGHSRLRRARSRPVLRRQPGESHRALSFRYTRTREKWRSYIGISSVRIAVTQPGIRRAGVISEPLTIVHRIRCLVQRRAELVLRERADPMVVRRERAVLLWLYWNWR